MKTKYTAVIVFIIMCIIMPSHQGVLAENAPEIIISNVSVEDVTDVFDIEISLKNNPGIASAKITIEYNPTVLTLINVSDAGILGSTSHSPSLESPYNLYWNNGSATKNFAVDGTIATLTFTVNKNANVGTYPIRVYYDKDNILNVNMDSVDFSTIDGKVKIIGNSSNNVSSNNIENNDVESVVSKKGNTDKLAQEVKESTNTKNQILLTINQKEMQVFGNIITNDVPPIIVNNRTMLPARIIAESLGATVNWFNEERKVEIEKDTLKILIFIDSNKAIINNQSTLLDSPAFIKDDRTYLPVRFICETLGATVEWENSSQKIIITK